MNHRYRTLQKKMLLSMEYYLNPVVTIFLVLRLSNTKKIHLLPLSTTIYEFQLAATSQLLHWLDNFRDFTVHFTKKCPIISISEHDPFSFWLCVLLFASFYFLFICFSIPC